MPDPVAPNVGMCRFDARKLMLIAVAKDPWNGDAEKYGSTFTQAVGKATLSRFHFSIRVIAGSWKRISKQMNVPNLPNGVSNAA